MKVKLLKGGNPMDWRPGDLVGTIATPGFGMFIGRDEDWIYWLCGGRLNRTVNYWSATRAKQKGWYGY